VINQCDIGDDRVRSYCAEQTLTVLLEIPYDRAIATAYARGVLAVDARPQLRANFRRLLTQVRAAVAAVGSRQRDRAS
jgi:MinD superfamily P-loop ATPase